MAEAPNVKAEPNGPIVVVVEGAASKAELAVLLSASTELPKPPALPKTMLLAVVAADVAVLPKVNDGPAVVVAIRPKGPGAVAAMAEGCVEAPAANKLAGELLGEVKMDTAVGAALVVLAVAALKLKAKPPASAGCATVAVLLVAVDAPKLNPFEETTGPVVAPNLSPKTEVVDAELTEAKLSPRFAAEVVEVAGEALDGANRVAEEVSGDWPKREGLPTLKLLTAGLPNRDEATLKGPATAAVKAKPPVDATEVVVAAAVVEPTGDPKAGDLNVGAVVEVALKAKFGTVEPAAPKAELLLVAADVEGATPNKKVELDVVEGTEEVVDVAAIETPFCVMANGANSVGVEVAALLAGAVDANMEVARLAAVVDGRVKGKPGEGLLEADWLVDREVPDDAEVKAPNEKAGFVAAPVALMAPNSDEAVVVVVMGTALEASAEEDEVLDPKTGASEAKPGAVTKENPGTAGAVVDGAVGLAPKLKSVEVVS